MNRRDFLSFAAIAPAVAMAPLDAFGAAPVEMSGPWGVDFDWEEFEDLLSMTGDVIPPGTIVQIAGVYHINPPIR